MKTTTYGPWASGKRRRPAGTRSSSSSPRRRRRSKRRGGLGATLVSILLSVAALACLLLGLVLESLLAYLVAATFAVSVVAQRRAMAMEMRRAERDRGQVIPPRPRKTRPGPPTGERGRKMREEADAARRAGAESSTATSGVIRCTETSRPIDECTCASRHVRTAEGVKAFGRPLGSPIGRRSKQAPT